MIIPTVTITKDGTTFSMDVYSRLLVNRIVYVQGEITQQSANSIKAQLIHLEAEDPNKDIIMYIDSPGGEITTGLGIVDTMNYISCDVQTICVGMAASMGSVLLAAGTKGKRYALPNSDIMVHQPSGGIKGTSEEIQIYCNHINKTRERLIEFYMNVTDNTRDVIEKAFMSDTWMTAQEALDFKLIDHIATSRT